MGICGSKCWYSIDLKTARSIKELEYNCQCGNVNKFTIENPHEFYCCNQMEPCLLINGTITCTDGIFTNINEKCGSVCPTAYLMSEIALSTNQYTHTSMCYAYGNEDNDRISHIYYNKIFMNSNVIKDQKNFAIKFCGRSPGSQLCVSMEKGKYEYDQCFNSIIQ